MDHLGHFSLYLIRETTSLREVVGLPRFLHSFFAEALAQTRAHVLGSGGNALVCFDICDVVLLVNPAKNQGQCLLSVIGDVAVARPQGFAASRSQDGSMAPALPFSERAPSMASTGPALLSGPQGRGESPVLAAATLPTLCRFNSGGSPPSV